jgi:hypothetical protein
MITTVSRQETHRPAWSWGFLAAGPVGLNEASYRNVSAYFQTLQRPVGLLGGNSEVDG